MRVARACQTHCLSRALVRRSRWTLSLDYHKIHAMRQRSSSAILYVHEKAQGGETATANPSKVAREAMPRTGAIATTTKLKQDAASGVHVRVTNLHLQTHPAVLLALRETSREEAQNLTLLLASESAQRFGPSLALSIDTRRQNQDREADKVKRVHRVQLVKG